MQEKVHRRAWHGHAQSDHRCHRDCALGFHTERVSEPAEVIPALRRALDVNTSGRPAYIEFICCQYPVYGQWVGRGAE